ncbi:MAG: hypothetical protein ACPGU4_01715 [Flavobacteriales bacterium]
MKTLRQLVAVALLLGSYHVGMAQSNSSVQDLKPVEIAKRDTDVKTAKVKSEVKHKTSVNKAAVLSADEKRAYMQANPRTVVKHDLKLKPNVKIVSSSSSSDKEYAAKKDAAVRKQLETKKAKSTTKK